MFMHRSFVRLTRRRLSWSLALGLVLALAVGSPAFAQSAPEGTLRVALEIPVNLDPANASADTEIAILNAVYDYLVDVDANNDIVPRLATSWTVSEDGLSYVFELASEARWHDGDPVTPADVIATFDRLRAPDSGLPTVDLYADIVEITATAEHEVTFQLANTNPFFLYDLSDNHALIVKAGATNLGTEFNGSGPFKVVQYYAEDRMLLEANQDYFVAGEPGVAELQLIFFSDQAASVSALRGGQIDLVTRMPTALFPSLEGVAGIQTVSTPTNGFDLIRLRSDRAPGNDPRVVEALKLAVDRQAITEVVTQGLGVVGHDTPIGPLYQAYFAPDIVPPVRDVARAKELLIEAGYADGLKIDLHTPDTGDRPDLAVVLKEQLAEAGFDINVIVEPESVYYGDDGWLEVDFGITGWGSRPFPQFYLDTMLKCGAPWNESHYCNEDFDRLVELAGTTLDDAERVDAYRQIQEILATSGPIIIPYFFPQVGAIRDGFTGLEMKAFPGRTDLAAIRVAN